RWPEDTALWTDYTAVDKATDRIYASFEQTRDGYILPGCLSVRGKPNGIGKDNSFEDGGFDLTTTSTTSTLSLKSSSMLPDIPLWACSPSSDVMFIICMTLQGPGASGSYFSGEHQMCASAA
ncbi:hypothetical protein JOQ06_017564, partial [Pogonophryne albipinna]